MSTEMIQAGVEPAHNVGIKDLATILIKHFGLTEGKFELAVEFQIGLGGVGPDKAAPIPGVVVGLRAVGLQAAREGMPNAVDAAEVSAPPTRKRTSRAKKA
jgi:hypothetical protein